MHAFALAGQGLNHLQNPAKANAFKHATRVRCALRRELEAVMRKLDLHAEVEVCVVGEGFKVSSEKLFNRNVNFKLTTTCE
jgi:hypothetical protein